MVVVSTTLQVGIAAFCNGDPLTKGQKTAYGQAASFPPELLEQYISETEAAKAKDKSVKSPNVKSFITWAKAKLYMNFGRKVQLFPTPEQEKQLLLNVDAYRWTYNFLYAHRRDNAVIPWKKACVSAYYIASCRCEPVVLPKFPNWEADYKLVSQKSGNRPDWAQDAPTDVINSCVHSFPKKPSGFRQKAKVAQEFVILQGNKISITEHDIKLPKIGAIKRSCPGYIPLDAKICSIGISFKNGKWYAGISMQSKDPKPPLRTEGKRLGIDVGARRLATTWNGDYHTAYASKKQEDKLFRMEKNLRRWQRRAARRFIKDAQQQSKRYEYAQNEVRRIHERITNIHNDNLHQVSHRILRSNVKEIVVEDLNVKGMLTKSKKPGKKMRGRQLRRIMAAAAVSRLLSFLSYKSEWRGIKKIIAVQFYPSSKLCCDCWIKNADLGSEEYWICLNCKVRHQRDENASRTLYAYTEDFGAAIAALERPEGPPDSKEQAITAAIAAVACLYHGITAVV